AAAEMRERISKRLNSLLKQQPDNRLLMRQRLLLGSANISTIDSFCSELIRQNCHRLNISPSFRIAGENERIILRSDAVTLTLEDMYADKSVRDDFLRLAEQISGEKDDKRLAAIILNIFDFICSCPFPHDWLEEKHKMYTDYISVEKTAWFDIISDHTMRTLEHCEKLCQSALDLMAGEDVISGKYGPAIYDDLAHIKELKKLLQQKSWDSVYQYLHFKLIFTAFGKLYKYSDQETKNAVASIRKNVKDTLSGLLEIWCANEDETRNDISLLRPMIDVLFEAVKRFEKNFTALKQEKNLLDYNDLEHLTVKLLVQKNEDGNYIRTAFAYDFSKRYSEILVDEYQDINETQNLIFRALSKDEKNLFTVGDVKQSIYRFRQARPEIFLEQYNNLPDFNGENYPAKITLGKNFRSRIEVTETVNFIFRQIMQGTGGLYYDSGHELEAAAKYESAANMQTELHIVERSQLDTTVAEGYYIAKIIKDSMANGLTVTDKDGTVRPAVFGDFCVLLRGTKDILMPLIEAMAQCGVPAKAEKKGGFFGTKEISFMLSLLRIIDNPMQDIPLAAVLLSPVFGFTPDMLSEARIGSRGGTLYSAFIKKAEQDTDSHEYKFLQTLAEFRRKSAVLSCDRLINEIYEQTGVYSVFSAMRNGSLRLANLRLLLDYARSYEQNGSRKGLGGFIGFIDRLQQEKGDLAAADSLASQSDNVKIMSIHGSKGLEFPVCIIAGITKEFNLKDTTDSIILHSGYGVGLKIRGSNGLQLYDTVPRKALSLCTVKESIAEEMRILYVALTRAREKLIMIASYEDCESKLSSFSSAGEITPYYAENARSFAKWIIPCVLRHPDSGELRRIAGAQNIRTLDCPVAIKTVFGTAEQPGIAETVTENTPDIRVADRLTSQIADRLSFVYPYASRLNIPSKVTASQLTKEKDANRHHFFARPAFTYSEKMTASEKGTAIHQFMQYADYENAGI
ncbi:MAG: helicase-exonuclease AddAB subunit AddA, partial [Clostridia bacterium]|nr:helicase-exonuclease AddAB subunit AddA [Clostridia bacterium]